MDGLALLCNLFADGPVTLKRLRQAQLAELHELERVPAERLAECLHASVPQARAFAEEARKLARRLAEERVSSEAARPTPVRVAAQSAEPVPVPADAVLLRPGLFAGLDEARCTRLLQHQVRSATALSERAGLDLARRTGIPYAALLELARAARAFLREQGAARPALPELRSEELVPSPRRVREAAPARRAEPALPVEEPESAGPFG